MHLLYICNQQAKIVLRENYINEDYARVRTDFYHIERKESLVSIASYCLMPNHFHLLIRETVEGGVSKFMQKLKTAYTMYFNEKYGRRGTLFESSYKAKHITDDVYLKYVISYIHLNPVKLIQPSWKKDGITDTKKTLAYLNNYHASSYIDYAVNNREETNILDKESVLRNFDGTPNFKMFVKFWLSYKE